MTPNLLTEEFAFPWGVRGVFGTKIFEVAKRFKGERGFRDRGRRWEIILDLSGVCPDLSRRQGKGESPG